MFVFVRAPSGGWIQQAYIKSSSPDATDFFGWSVGLSADGSTLATGSYGEDGSAAGLGGVPEPVSEVLEPGRVTEVELRP